MVELDRAVSVFLNGLTRHSWTLDAFMDVLSRDAFVKGGVLVTLLWWAWFAKPSGAGQVENRRTVVATLAGCFVALATASALGRLLPFRPRPIHDPALGLTPAYGTPPDRLDAWSAFPSDNAVLCFGLAAGLFLVSRRVGLLALVYVAVLVVAPRLYLGLHYPSDILGGALIGVAVVQAANLPPFQRRLTDPLLRWGERQPGTFYAVVFVVSFQIATFFASVRQMGRFLHEALSAAWGPVG